MAGYFCGTTLPAFAAFLNEDRELNINDKVYRFGCKNVKVLQPESPLIVNPVERITSENKNTSLEETSFTLLTGSYR